MTTINKNEALKRLTSLENEAKELRNIINAPVKITDRIKTFSDVLAVAGRKKEEFEEMPGETADECAYRKLKLIAEVYNEGEVLDSMNTNQYKYYPYFKIVPSGFGLSYFNYDGWTSYSSVGVRLCFKSSELAIDAGKKFTDIYATFLINKQ
jgi:hypothetical protein